MSHLSNYPVVKCLAPKACIYWTEHNSLMFFAEQHFGFTTYWRTESLLDPISAYREVGVGVVMVREDGLLPPQDLHYPTHPHPNPNQPVRAGRDRQHNPPSWPQGTKPDIGVTGAHFDSS